MPRRRCFVIMPFDPSFDDIFRDIESTAAAAGLDCRRGDHHRRPGAVLDQIIEDIAASDLVIADFSDRNPNVFYEVGVAHRVRGPSRTIHITRRHDDVPYDLQGHRYLLYTHADAGRAKLRQELAAWIRNAMEENFPESEDAVVGKVARTQRIIDACRLIAHEWDGANVEEPRVIRILAGVASPAISDHEYDEGDVQYQELLLSERDSLLELLSRSAEIRMVLHLPSERSKGKPWQRLALRLHRMKCLLNRETDSDTAERRRLDGAFADRCRVTFSTIPSPNTLILGNRITFEAFRRGVARGFDGTVWSTRRKDIEAQNAAFDMLFEQCSQSAPVGVPGAQGPAIEAILKALDAYRVSCGGEWDDSIFRRYPC